MEIKTGDVIRNKNPYHGEGSRRVCELGDTRFKAEHINCERFPALNGMVEIMDYDTLEFYHITKPESFISIT